MDFYSKKQTIENHRNSKFGCAIFCIALGFFLLGFNLGWIPLLYKPLIISWQMLLIVIGISLLIKKRFTGGILLIGIGVFFILPILSTIFPEYMGDEIFSLKSYWPVLLIIGGILLLVKIGKNKTMYKNCRAKKETCSDSDYIEKNIMFGGSEQIIFSSDFRGGDVNVGFGELILDLRKVSRTSNAVLEANVMFGTIIIHIPSQWLVEIKSNTLFGSIEDKRIDKNPKNDENETIPEFTLQLDCSSMFGSIEIRN